MVTTFYSVCVAGTHSGVGKTTVSLGLMAALQRRGLTVQPFKCGPDYIDAGHHRRVCGRASRNLDTWMMRASGVTDSYVSATADVDVAVVEGVMGLFDGTSACSTEGSTAHVAELLDLPVVLVVNAGAMARSVAALVKGYADFEPGVKIVGVVANGVSSESHAKLLRKSLAAAGLPPLVGTLPRSEMWKLPERHLGLISDTESKQDPAWFQSLADGIEKHLDVDRILDMCRVTRREPGSATGTGAPGRRARLGVARDEAFHFYYQDNLDLLERCGAELVPFSPLQDNAVPDDLDGLYIGGGFPEMFAARLEDNMSMRESVCAFADAGGIVYAECGGLMYLCRQLEDLDGRAWEMCGVLDVETKMESRLRRLGYVEAATVEQSLFGDEGTVLRGHEFHWSSVYGKSAVLTPVYELRNAEGEPCGTGGMREGRVWASYVHVHFASNPDACRTWVEWMERRRGERG